MGLSFNLAIECGQLEEDAIAVRDFFIGNSITSKNPRGIKYSIGVRHDSEINYWVIVTPVGLVVPGRDEQAELRSARVVTEISVQLYKYLLTAPSFRFALAGWEVEEFSSYSELLKDWVTCSLFDGLVISREIWELTGNAEGFEIFKTGYYWRPYKGEIHGF